MSISAGFGGRRRETFPPSRGWSSDQSGRPFVGRPTDTPVRSSIWRAARRVKVSRRMRSAGVPVASNHATRAERAVVLPVPAPARTRSGPPSWLTAARWASLSSSIQANICSIVADPGPAESRAIGDPEAPTCSIRPSSMTRGYLGPESTSASATIRRRVRLRPRPAKDLGTPSPQHHTLLTSERPIVSA